MKYVKGEQTYKLGDLPMQKILVVADGETEGPWARQADDHAVVQNMDDLFCWKLVGDGDNGEFLMYLLDMIHEREDLLGTG